MDIQHLKKPQERVQYLEKFNPETQTWLVSDLKSKFEVQKFCFKDRSVLAESSVLRAREFWNTLFTQLCPNTQIISRSLTKSLIRMWLKQGSVEWAKAPGVGQRLFSFMQSILPILCEKDSQRLLVEWLQENPSCLIQWGGWFELSVIVWNEFRKENMVPSEWVTGFLLVELKENPQVSWDQELIVDLGCDLSAIEADLLKQLSQERKITLLQPTPSWKSQYFSSFWGFAALEGKSLFDGYENARTGDGKYTFPSNQNIKLKKFTTMISEVKDVVSQVRLWLDEGVSKSNILVVAPDLEIYWPVLGPYFEEEGILVTKDVVSSLQSYPAISRWLARLRIERGQVEFVDLELSLYSRNEKIILPYEKFFALFSRLYSAMDLKRDFQVERLFAMEIKEGDILNRDEFIAWTLRFWQTEEGTDKLELAIGALLQECHNHLGMELTAWLKFFEEICSKIEVKVRVATGDEVGLVKISEAHWLEATHIYVMGLTESGLIKSEGSALPLKDVLKISQDLGFYLSFPDKAQTEFELAWLLERSYTEIHLSSPATNFNGSLEPTSLFWLKGSLLLKGREKAESIEAPQFSRWDELQHSSLEQICEVKGWSLDKKQLMESSFRWDWDQHSLPSYGKSLALNLSVTALERYNQCPFLFSAEKLFRLKDDPPLDLDENPMSRGKLIHGIFECLTKEPMRFCYSREEMEKVVDDVRAAKKIRVADQRLWLSLRKRYVELIERFLNFEKAWRGQFPEMEIVSRELPIQAIWDLEKGELRNRENESSAGIPFRGSIDRVDSLKSHREEYVIVDYKSTSNSLTHHGSWLKAKKFQMGLYAQALQNGCTDLDSHEVIGAFYYTAKNMDRSKGFKISGRGTDHYPSDNRRERSWISDEGLSAFYKGINHEVQQLVLKMKAGEFQPMPTSAQKRKCSSCSWNSLCRYNY